MNFAKMLLTPVTPLYERSPEMDTAEARSRHAGLASGAIRRAERDAVYLSQIASGCVKQNQLVESLGVSSKYVGKRLRDMVWRGLLVRLPDNSYRVRQ